MSVPVSAAMGSWAAVDWGAGAEPAAACAVLVLGGARLAKGSGV